MTIALSPFSPYLLLFKIIFFDVIIWLSILFDLVRKLLSISMKNKKNNKRSEDQRELGKDIPRMADKNWI